MIEMAVAIAAEQSPRRPTQSRADEALRNARTCYDHLAGRLGVALTDALLKQHWVALASDGGEVTELGVGALTKSD